MPILFNYSSLTFENVNLGYSGLIFNLKKDHLTVDLFNSDFDKHYEYHYHTNMKTAHLNTIFVYFIAPTVDKNVEIKVDQINEIPTIIKRFGCETCIVKYRAITYEDLLDQLINQISTEQQSSFINQFADNIKTGQPTYKYAHNIKII